MSGGIYIASKTVHAPRWRRYRDEGVPFISTWIDEAGQGETMLFEDLWFRCVREAKLAAVLIVYAEPGEVLKGALVEVGVALGNGVRVITVGPQPGSFVNHPLVVVTETMARALELARAFLLKHGPMHCRTHGGFGFSSDCADCQVSGISNGVTAR